MITADVEINEEFGSKECTRKESPELSQLRRQDGGLDRSSLDHDKKKGNPRLVARQEIEKAQHLMYGLIIFCKRMEQDLRSSSYSGTELE